MPEEKPKKERFKITPSVYLILEREGQVLLSLRQNTGYEDGKYGLPAGSKEAGEYPTEALARECLEEIGIEIKPQDLNCVHVMARIRDVNSERVDMFFVTKNWTGKPKNMEPGKCNQIEWFPIENLPGNTIPYIREVIKHWKNGVSYSEFGK